MNKPNLHADLFNKVIYLHSLYCVEKRIGNKFFSSDDDSLEDAWEIAKDERHNYQAQLKQEIAALDNCFTKKILSDAFDNAIDEDFYDDV